MELKLGSIPVRVQGWFVIMAVLLGANERDPVKLGLWVATVVVSVVIHELGHAMMGKAFGLIPRIELHGMGGTTSFARPPVPAAAAVGRPSAEPPEAPKRELGTARSVAISLAGPFAGFLFALLVLLSQMLGLHPSHPLATYAVSLLFAVNVGWGVFNLFPMLPLDGGNVLRYILLAITKNQGEKISRVVSIVVAAGIALLAVRREQWWVLYLGVLFAFQNVQSLRQLGQAKVDQSAAEAIDKAFRAFQENDSKRAIALLQPLALGGLSGDLRNLAVRIHVASLIREGRAADAVSMIERERPVIPPEELQEYATALRDLGRGEDADRITAMGNAPPPLSEFRA